MNILIIQENGRHEKNRNFRECFSFQKAFLKLGYSSTVWGLGHTNFNEPIDFESFDAIINLENYDESGWIPDLSKVKTKKYLWSIDAHVRGIQPYLKEFNRGGYSKILQSTLDYVDQNSVWFPNAFDDTLIKPLNISKNYDVGFCGNINNRGSLLNLLSKKFNLKKDIFVIGEDMVRAINSYKVHFNCNIGIDVNYRNFETIGCGTALITSYNNAYQFLGFENNKNCLIYKNESELISGVERLLSDYKFRNSIEKEGLKLSFNHTYVERAKHFIENIL